MSGFDSYAGIAGQLDATGLTEVVLLMRLPPSRVRPDVWRIELVDESGEALPLVSGGDWPGSQEIHEWIYDASGHTRVGFEVETAGSDHPGSAHTIIVDRVYVR